MESRNVLFAVILSTIVLVFWSTFFEPPIVEQKPLKNQTTNTQNNNSPSIDDVETKNEITRNEAINKTSRMGF